MNHYRLFWGRYLQWEQPFPTDEVAIAEAKTCIPNDARDWRLEKIVKIADDSTHGPGTQSYGK